MWWRMMMGSGWRKRRGIVVHQRHCRMRRVVWLQAIVVAPIETAERRMRAIEIWNSNRPARGCRRVGGAVITRQGGCRRTRARTKEWRWMMVRGCNWRMNRSRMGTVGRRM